MKQRNPDQELKRKPKGREVPPRGRRNNTMGPQEPVRIMARGHLNPGDLQPMVRLSIGDLADLSFPAAAMRSVVDLISAQIVIAELQAGWAKESALRAGIIAAEFPAPTLRESIEEGVAAFQDMLMDAWAVGSTIVNLQVGGEERPKNQTAPGQGEEPENPPTQ